MISDMSGIPGSRGRERSLAPLSPPSACSFTTVGACASEAGITAGTLFPVLPIRCVDPDHDRDSLRLHGEVVFAPRPAHPSPLSSPTGCQWRPPERVHHAPEDAAVAPSVEIIPDRCQGRKTLGACTPLAPGRKPGPDRVDDLAKTGGSRAGARRWGRKQRQDPLPIRVGHGAFLS